MANETATQAIEAVNNVAGAINNAASGVQAVQGTVETAVTNAAQTGEKIATSAGEILQGYLVRALDATGQVIDKAVDMVQEQAPLLVKEVLNWYFAYNLIFFIVGVIGMIAVVTWWVKQLKWAKVQSKLPREDQSSWYRNYETYDIEKRHTRVAFNFLLIIPFVVSASQLNLEWLKIYIAPRLWLIEYTAQLVKNGTGH